jgi:hypothetical protein
LDDADAITGISGGFGRMQIFPPPRIVQSGPMVFNNIRLENSTVGVVNTGDVKSIGSVVTTAKTAGHEALATAFKEFTEAVLTSQDLQQEAKNETISQLAFLSQQVVSKQKQAPSVIRSIIFSIERTINGAAIGGNPVAATTRSAAYPCRGFSSESCGRRICRHYLYRIAPEASCGKFSKTAL